jgi:two-component system, OmpR family, phosphate regulon response regulator PhoB
MDASILISTNAPAAERIPATKRKSLLIVEDNSVVAKMISLVLSPSHYDIRVVSNAEEGLAAAHAKLPDLAILDVRLPGQMNGLELCRRLKSISANTGRTPMVVMLSALNHDHDLEEGYRAGAEMYIAKPFSPLTLRRIVSLMVGGPHMAPNGRYCDD